MMGMKRWMKRIGVAFTTLLILTSQASVVLARAGGGKGGSLGGSAGKSFGGGSFSGGSFSSGGLSSGGLGFPSRGFGGFFPFFWFGGSSGGTGSFFGGIFNLIVLIGILYLIYRMFISSKRSRQGRDRGKGFRNPFQTGNKPDYRNNSDIRDSDEAPVDITGRPITNDGNLRRFSKAIDYTLKNMHYYAETFPRWDRDYLVGRVRQVYFWIQDAWTRQDLSGGEDYLATTLLERYRRDLVAMKGRGERNVIKEPVLHPEDVEFIHSHLEEMQEHFVVMISASLYDYTVDASGRIIAGEDDNRLYFTEFWEFHWINNQWVLSEIYQEDALEVTKIARGDEY